MDDEEKCLPFLVVVDLYGDDFQFAITFVDAHVTPARATLIGDRPGRGRVRHDVSHGGPADAVLARRLGEPDLHLQDNVRHNQFCPTETYCLVCVLELDDRVFLRTLASGRRDKSLWTVGRHVSGRNYPYPSTGN